MQRNQPLAGRDVSVASEKPTQGREHTMSEQRVSKPVSHLQSGGRARPFPECLSRPSSGRCPMVRTWPKLPRPSRPGWVAYPSLATQSPSMARSPSPSLARLAAGRLAVRSSLGERPTGEEVDRKRCQALDPDPTKCCSLQRNINARSKENKHCSVLPSLVPCIESCGKRKKTAVEREIMPQESSNRESRHR